MKRYRQLLSLLLAIVMVIGLIPMSAFANSASVEVGDAVVDSGTATPEAGGSDATTGSNLDFSNPTALYMDKDLTVIPDEEKVDQGIYEIYSFTSSENDWYRISFAAQDGVPILLTQCYDGEYNLMDHQNGTSLAEFDVYMEAGQTYYFAVLPLTFDYYYTASVSTLEASTALTLDETEISGYVGEDHWIGWDFDGIPEQVEWEVEDSTIAYIGAGDEGSVGVVFQKAGVTTLTATSENGLTASCEITVYPLPTLQLDEAYRVDLSSEKSQTFLFMPAEDGYYNFDVDYTSYGGTEYSVWMALTYENGETVNSGSNNLSACYLDSSEKYHLMVRYNTSSSDVIVGTFDLIASQGAAAERMYLSPYDQTLYEGGYGYVQACFEPEGCAPQEVTFTSGDNTIVSVDQTGRLTAHSEGSARIYADSGNFSAYAYVTVVGANILESETKVTETVDSISSSGNLMVYRFTAPEDGTYGATFKSTHSEFSASVLNAQGIQCGYDAGDQFRLDVVMEEGETYFYKFKLWEPQTYSLCVNKLLASTTMSIDAHTTSGYVDANASYKYNVVFDGVAEEVTWSSSNSTVATVSPSGWVQFVGDGTATITATSESGLTASVDVMVFAVPVLTLDQWVNVTIGSGIGPRYQFTPKESGAYVFEMDNYMGYETLRTSYVITCGTNSLGSYPNGESVYLEGGFTYTITPYWNAWDGIGDCAFSIRIKKGIDATAIVTSPAALTLYVGQEKPLYYSFEPEDAVKETVAWEVEDPSVAEIDGWSAENVWLYGLKEGTTTVTVTSRSGLTATATVTVAERPKVDLLLDTPYTVDAAVDGGDVLFKFIPEESGTYAFYSYDNSYDTRAFLYDSDMNWLAENDDYNDLNFRIVYYLTAGETYILNARPYSSQTTGTYKVIAEKAPAAEYVTVDQGETYMGYAGKSVYFSISQGPEGCAWENYAWSSSDSNVVSVDEWGNAQFLSAGTAILTVTTENGLTDSITVTVRSLADIPTIQLDEVQKFSTWAEAKALRSFTPEESGWYAFYSFKNNVLTDCIDLNGNVYDSQMQLVSGSGMNMENNNFRVQFYGEAGKTYYLEAIPNEEDDEGAYKISVCAASVATGVAIENGAERLTGFISDTGGCWPSVTFYPEDAVEEGWTWSVADESIAVYGNNGVQFLTEGETTLTVTTDSGLTDTIILDSRDATEVEFEKEYTVSMEDDGGRGQFTVTPEKDGTYLLEMIKPEFSFWWQVTDSNGESCEVSGWSNRSSEWGSFDVVAGETYTILYYPNDSSATGTNTVRFFDITEEGYIGFADGNTATLSVGGFLNLYSYVCVPEYAALTFKSSDESVVTVDNTNYSLKGISAGTAEIAVNSENGYTTTLTVTVVDNILQKDTAVTGTAECYEWVYYTFTPEKTAEYTFAFSSDAWKQFEIISDGWTIADSDFDDSGLYYINCVLTADVTYTVAIELEEKATYLLSVSEAVDPESISLDLGDARTAYVGDAFELYTTVSPANAKRSGLTWDWNNGDIAYQSEYYVNFIAPGTGTMTVTTPNGKTDSITFTVKERNEAPSLTLDVPAAVEGDGRFTFIPEESGTYYFTSSSADGVDPWCTLGVLDEEYNLEYMDQDDEGAGRGNDFLLTAQLTAGECYYLQTGYYGNSKELPDYKVMVYQPQKATGISFDAGEYVVIESGDQFNLEVSFLPFGAEDEGYSFICDNEEVLYSDDYGYISGYAPGIANVTVTTESGFTDTITVIVVEDNEVFSLELDQAVTSQAFYKTFDWNYRFEAEKSSSYEVVAECDHEIKVTVRDIYGDILAEEIGTSLLLSIELLEKEQCFIFVESWDPDWYPSYSLKVQENPDKDWTFTVNNDAATITGYSGDAEDLVIPAKINGYPVTVINSAVFQNNTALKSVTFPEGLTTIGSFSFSGCKNLAKVVLPTTLTTVGRYAFANCGITDVYFDDTAEAWAKVTINTGNDPLTNATLHLHVHEFEVYVSNQDGDCFTDTTGTAKCVGCEVTDTKVIQVAPGKHTESDPVVEQEPDCGNDGWGYTECTVCGNTLESYIELPATGDHTESEVIVEEAPDCGNDGWGYTECTVCGELMAKYVTLKATGKHTAGELAITKEPTCSEAGSGYFPCTVCGGIAIADATLVPTNNHIEGETIVDVEPTATTEGSGHTECTVCGQTVTADIVISALGVTVNWTYTIKDSAVTITGYEGNAEDLEIPALLEGYPVTTIQSGVFQGETALKNVKFPVTLTTIGSYAFSGCTALTEIDLPENVSAVGRYAFANCKNLKSITVRNPYLTFGANAYPATTEIIYAYAMDVSKPHFTVDASNINLAVLHTAGLSATRLYWGYAGTEEIETQDWNTFASAVPSAIRVSDYNPTDGETYAMTNSGYYLFWISYTDANGETQNICHTVYAGGALDENYGKPYLEFDKTGRVAWMNLNGTTVQKMYWGFIGDTDYKYTTWDEFCTRVRNNSSYLPDYGVKDGEGYVVNEVGYYRFVIVYLDAQGIRQERYFTIQSETPAIAPSIDNSALSNMGVLVNEEEYSSKVYYGYIGGENTKYIDFDTFKATAESFTTSFGPRPGTAFRMDKAGYWRFVINYNVNGATKDAVCTVYVDEADLSLGTPEVTQSGTQVTLDYNGSTVTKMYIGYMGTEEVEVDSWADYTALRQSNTTYYGPKDGTTTDLGKNAGYYTVVVTYNAGGADQLAFFTFNLK